MFSLSGLQQVMSDSINPLQIRKCNFVIPQLFPSQLSTETVREFLPKPVIAHGLRAQPEMILVWAVTN